MNEQPHDADELDVETTYLSATEQSFLNQLGDMVADHEVRIEQLEKDAKDPDPPRDWISRNQLRSQWEDLAQWVDWLNDNYSQPDDRRVPACWPAHKGLVHQLAALRSAWRAAVLDDEKSKEQGNAMVAFHDYHLMPFFQRLSDRHLYPCIHAAHRPDEEHAPTDLSYLPQGLLENRPDATGERQPTTDAEDAPVLHTEGA